LKKFFVKVEASAGFLLNRPEMRRPVASPPAAVGSKQCARPRQHFFYKKNDWLFNRKMMWGLRGKIL
jgi:hypothetical protein